MKMAEIHDNKILSYTVDLENQNIIIHTEYWYHDVCEKTDIIFENVTAHLFKDESKGSILFDIEAYDLDDFIEENKELLGKQRDYGWPALYKTEDELLAKLKDNNQSYYVITSSVGLYGWVLAEKMKVDKSNN
jgi:hypothetical protein